MAARQKLHAAVFAVVMLALPVGGWMLASSISTSPVTAATITQPPRTVVVHHTRVVKKVVRGRVIRLKGGTQVVYVPRVVIHVRSCHPRRHHHCARRVVVPAHRIPLKAATVHQAVAVAAPSIPITVLETVTEPAQTVVLPAQTVTQTQTETSTEVVTVTVTVPILP